MLVNVTACKRPTTDSNTKSATSITDKWTYAAFELTSDSSGNDGVVGELASVDGNISNSNADQTAFALVSVSGGIKLGKTIMAIAEDVGDARLVDKLLVVGKDVITVLPKKAKVSEYQTAERAYPRLFAQTEKWIRKALNNYSTGPNGVNNFVKTSNEGKHLTINIVPGTLIDGEVKISAPNSAKDVTHLSVMANLKDLFIGDVLRFSRKFIDDVITAIGTD